MSTTRPEELHNFLNDGNALPKKSKDELGTYKMDFSGGYSNQGATLSVSKSTSHLLTVSLFVEKHELLRDDDLTEMKLGGNSHQRSFSLMHAMPVFLPQKLVPRQLLNIEPPNSKVDIPATLSFSTDLETTQTKHSSREKSFTVSLNSQASPWSLRYTHAYRRNTLDAFSSQKFL